MKNEDFIKLDFELRAGEDKKLYATNREDLAKAENIYNEEAHYGDYYGIVGTDSFLKKINESLLNAEVGKEYELEIPPEDAYGIRDPKNIKVHTVREFQRQNIDPVVGQEVIIDRKQGRIISVTPGRVMVDYNNRFAGKTIYYKYTVKEVISDPAEKVRSLLFMNYSSNAQKFGIKAEGEDLKLEVPEESKFDHYWFDVKFTVVNEIRKYIPDSNVVLVETYPKQEKVETPAEETPKETQEAPAENPQPAEPTTEAGPEKTANE